MSAAEAETEPTRYEGLVGQIQEERDRHEESGWRLVNLCFDAIEELRKQGYVIHDYADKDRLTATKRLSADLGRHRMGPATVYQYYKMWDRFGDTGKRHPGLTFGDHWTLVARSHAKNRPAAITALRKRRADVAAGRKPKYGSSTAAVLAATKGDEVGQAQDAINALTQARSRMRAANRTNVWDYPDHQKVLDHLAEIRAILDELDAKPWNPVTPEGTPKPVAVSV